MRDSQGQTSDITRRQWLDVTGKTPETPPPPQTPPRGYGHYIDWLFDLTNYYRPLIEGGMQPIGPHLTQWEKDSGALLMPFERRILLDIDLTFRRGMAEAREEYKERAKEQ